MAPPVPLNSEDISTETSYRRPPKRSRKSKSSKSNSDSVLPVPAHILSLPFELLAETLLYTASPKAVLAVARCNKYLCNTLLRPESEFIWRSVRNCCLPEPLPDPHTLHMSESAFAALVFDGGECASCKKMTYNMYSSWSLRVRFCSRPECKETWGKQNTTTITNFDALTRHVRKALAWIPLAESPACFYPSENPAKTWPEANKVYLTSTMNAALAEYGADSSTVVDTRHAADSIRSPQKMSFYVALYNWKHKRQVLERQVKADNKAFGMKLAAKEGYDYSQLLNGSATYQNLHAHRTKNLELITQQDYNLVADKIEAEMITTQDRQGRRTNEATLRANRAQVEQHYQRLVSASRSQVPADPLPSLAAFRAMPVLDLLQSPSGVAWAPNVKAKVSGVAHELQHETLVKQILTSELTRWRKSAEDELGATLGIPEWKTARNNKLHPVARLTARWNCGKCGNLPGAYKWDGCLDYLGVCKHECSKSKKKESNWKAENFVKDDKAINAMIKLVHLCGIDAEDPSSFKVLQGIGPRILCLSCPAPIVMFPSSVPGHSHRHEEMDMSLLTLTEAQALVVSPIEEGLTKKVMGPNDVSVKQAQKTWKFGCRHCEQHVPPPVEEKKAPEPARTDEKIVEEQAQEGGTTADEQPESGSGKIELVQKKENPKKQPKRFEFNGLRSHLKEKHSIALPHDEDFYHVPESREVQ
ncbi:hypothetical protein C8R45DRAFT_264013 [Mycena sanguinolenta]|nr:hypothetical protein C8R45DRAFT_264013 [Mycena sanguinolenta]